MIRRKEKRQEYIHEGLIDIVQRMYPNKSMPDATYLLGKDIWNGVDLNKRLRMVDKIINTNEKKKVRRK